MWKSRERYFCCLKKWISLKWLSRLVYFLIIDFDQMYSSHQQSCSIFIQTSFFLKRTNVSLRCYRFHPFNQAPEENFICRLGGLEGLRAHRRWNYSSEHRGSQCIRSTQKWPPASWQGLFRATSTNDESPRGRAKWEGLRDWPFVRGRYIGGSIRTDALVSEGQPLRLGASEKH